MVSVYYDFGIAMPLEFTRVNNAMIFFCPIEFDRTSDNVFCNFLKLFFRSGFLFYFCDGSQMKNPLTR
jgi:hypothetical protein